MCFIDNGDIEFTEILGALVRAMNTSNNYLMFKIASSKSSRMNANFIFQIRRYEFDFFDCLLK